MAEVLSKKERKAAEKAAKTEAKAAKKAAKMEGRDTSKKSRSWIAFLTAAIVAGIAFFALLTLQQNILNDFEKTSVIVTRTQILSGTDITAANAGDYFTVKEIPADLLPDGAYVYRESDWSGRDAFLMASVGNTYMTDTLMAGEILVAENLISSEFLNIGMGEGMVETSFAVSNISQTVAGTLRRGDMVSISIYDQNEETEDGVVLEGIMIKSAYAADGTLLGRGESGQAVMFVVILSEGQEQELNARLYQGGIIRLAKMNDVKY